MFLRQIVTYDEKGIQIMEQENAIPTQESKLYTQFVLNWFEEVLF